MARYFDRPFIQFNANAHAPLLRIGLQREWRWGRGQTCFTSLGFLWWERYR